MMIERIRAVYFSPTGGTKNVVRMIAGNLAEALGLPLAEENGQNDHCGETDITLPEAREMVYRFCSEDLVVVGSPVYAGRMPNKIAPDFRRCIKGNAIAVPVVVYGNRSFGGALAELKLILKENGFEIVGGAAVVSRHAFTDALASGRPDEADREEIREFARHVADMIRNAPAGGSFATISGDALKKSPNAGPNGIWDVSSWEDIPPYYTPLKEDGTPARFLKAKPVTDWDICDRCGACRDACPVGSIDGRMETTGICIKCQACVRKCPNGAKRFTDEDFLLHVRMLEQNYRGRSGNFFY